MSIPYRVEDYIAERRLPWDPLEHAPSATALQAAHYAHVAAGQVAKAVLLKDEAGFVVAVIPADHALPLREVDEATRRHLALASERELAQLFEDCAPGAVPAVGDAYGIPTVWDEALGESSDVYFEAGDHRTLVHMKGAYFAELMRAAQPLHRPHA